MKALRNIFSNDEVMALIDACGLVPSSLITRDLVERIQVQLSLARECEVMSAEQEKENHAFLAAVMERNRRSGKKLPDPFDFAEQGRFMFENFD